MHVVDTQKSPKFNTVKTSSTFNGSNKPRMPRRATEVDMLDGVVDMDIFNQIVALDEGDTSKEFSKTLVTAWCDQAEMALEEMRRFLAAGNIVDTAHKAHYLKGSSASLGLIKVSKTCQSIYNIQFPPSLARFRPMRTSSEYTSSSASSGSSSSASSSSMAISGSHNSHSRSPSESPVFEMEGMDFGAADRLDKVDRACVYLDELVAQIKQASDWLEKYYFESDKYAARA